MEEDLPQVWMTGQRCMRIFKWANRIKIIYNILTINLKLKIMKKTLAIAAMAVFAMVSCSKDQVIEQKQNEINFSVSTENTTKALEVYCANNYMTSFTVAADFNSKIYIIGDEMSVTSDGDVSNTGGKVSYWPDGVSSITPMTFYAIADGTMIKSTAGVPTANFTVNGAVDQQKDMLYSVKVQETSSSPVNLNFRHALSLIEFKAKNTNPNLKVEITGVTVGNVKNSGTFTFPNASTDSQNEEHTDNVAEATLNTGSWAGQEGKTSYSVTFGKVTADSDGENLTYIGTHDASTSFANSMILMPQGLSSAWDPTTGNLSAGSYLGVTCVISNVAGANETVLHNGVAYIPLGGGSSAWNPGKKYVYTFVFGTGNAGYKENGDPVLAPISYTVSVDDFDSFTGGNTDVEME